MLNHITIMGRLTRDPELRRTGAGVAVASFTLAVDDDFKDKDGNRKTIFVDCVAWRGLGETVAKYFTKGRMAVVSGKLDMREWTDKEGNNRRNAEIVADNVYFGDSKKDDGSHGGGTYGSAPANNYGTGGQYGSYGGGYPAPAPSYGGYSAPTGPSDFAMLEDDDAQLPF